MSLNLYDFGPKHMVRSERCPLFCPLVSPHRTSSWPLSKFQWLYLCCWVVANAWTFIHLLVWKIGSNTAQAAAAMWGVEQIKLGGLWDTGGERGGGRWRGAIWCTSVVHKQNPKLCGFFSLLNCVLNIFFPCLHGHFSTYKSAVSIQNRQMWGMQWRRSLCLCVCVCVICLYVK